jgi:hypothetical protein
MKKIFIRSPYFIEVDEAGQLTGKLEIFIWNKGTTEPTTPNYTLTKNVPSANQNKLSWNVANYASEFIKPISPVVVSVPTEENVNTWCFMRVVSYSDDVQVVDETFVCLNGYTNYSIGYNENNTATIVPLVNTNIKLTTFSGFNYINVWIEENDTFEYSSSHSTEFFTTVSEGLWKLPYDYDPYTLGYDGGANIFIINTEQLCEPKYTPITCTFVNRYGGWQFLTFFKASTEAIETEFKEFNMLPSSIDYNVLQGQRKRFNHQGKQSIKCNTGWVDENYFELIQDLLLSETVLLGGKPAVVKSKTSEKKTSLNNKVINYEIEFEYNFGLINDVI